MKTFIALSIASLLSAPVFAATYDCEGSLDTKGKVTITVTAKKFTIEGSYTNDNGRTVEIDCVAKAKDHPRAAEGYDYYDAVGKCEADFFAVDANMAENEKGYLKIVNTSGGDTHDSSGYMYAHFRCDK